MRGILGYKNSVHRVIRFVVVLGVAYLVCCCVPRQKPDTQRSDTRSDEHRVAVEKSAVEDPFPSATLALDIIRAQTTWELDGIIPYEAWQVVEDVQPTSFRIQDVAPNSFLRTDESEITSQEMRRRAVVLRGNMGLVDAKYLLEHQIDIPADWEDCYLVFPGTVLRKSTDGHLFIPILIYGTYGGWNLYFSDLDADWYMDGCVVSVQW